MANLNQNRLHALLAYDPYTGKLVWKFRPRNDFVLERDWKSWNTRFHGKEAGWRDDAGYTRLNIDGKNPRAHQVIWAYVHGDLDPKMEIDHINGKKDDNRLVNLRAVKEAENRRNMARSKRNRSGVTGVSWDNSRGKWTARITYERRVIAIGRFDSFDTAVAARKLAEQQYGFHENHGRG